MPEPDDHLSSSRAPTALVVRTVLLGLLLLSACDSSGPTSPGRATFVIRACAGSTSGADVFRVAVDDPDEVRRAESLIGASRRAIVSGSLVGGDGGFNRPWSWHLDPRSVRFVEVAIEVCDGCPSAVERELGYWLGQVRQFCPWTTEVMARER